MVVLMQTSGPAPGMAPLTDRSEAALAMADAARRVSDFARGMVTGTSGTVPGVVVGDAVQLVALAREVLHSAITLELAGDSSWVDLVAELGDQAESVRTEWSSRTAERATMTARVGELALVAADPAADQVARAEELDEWSCRHREAGDLDDGACPVSRSLERTDVPAALGHLVQLRAAREAHTRWFGDAVTAAAEDDGQELPARSRPPGSLGSSSVSAGVEWTRSLPRKRSAATVLITDPQGRVLVVKPTYKPRWELPGGAVEDGESPAAAGAREIAEELGIEHAPGRLLVLDYVPGSPERTEGLIVVFDGGMIDGDAGLRLPAQELSAAAFVAEEELGEYLPALQTRRARAALCARTAGAALYLENGFEPTERA